MTVLIAKPQTITKRTRCFVCSENGTEILATIIINLINKRH